MRWKMLALVAQMLGISWGALVAASLGARHAPRLLLEAERIERDEAATPENRRFARLVLKAA